MLIYVAHPYNNEEENKKAVEEIIKILVTNNPDHTFISPIHTFGFMYDFVDNYAQGINMCFNLLSACKKLILCGDCESSVRERLCRDYRYTNYNIQRRRNSN